MIYLTVEEVINIHDALILEYGGLQGIRDMGLLISAIEMPKATMFGEPLHQSLFDKAAAYLYHIVCNHPFLDGNKRTGTSAALIFLKQNGVKDKYSIKELENIVLNVAQGKINKNDISIFLQKNP